MILALAGRLGRGALDLLLPPQCLTCDSVVDEPGRLSRPYWGLSHSFDARTGKRSQTRYIARTVQSKVKGTEPANAFPIISSYVTSYAREYMASVMRALPERSLLYTATDSLIVTQAGYDHLIASGMVDPEACGKFRLEGVYPEAEICGPNWYRKGDTWTISGLHGSAHHEPGFGAVMSAVSRNL